MSVSGFVKATNCAEFTRQRLLQGVWGQGDIRGVSGRNVVKNHMFVLMLSEEHVLKSAEDNMLMTTDVHMNDHHLDRTYLPKRKDTCLHTYMSYMGCIACICCAVLLTALQNLTYTPPPPSVPFSSRLHHVILLLLFHLTVT